MDAGIRNKVVATGLAVAGVIAAVATFTSAPSGATLAPRLAAATSPQVEAQAPLPYGVDVSNHDRNFDWAQDKVAFGIAKATEGTSFVDSTFASEWAKIGENGLVRGAYHFGHPGNDPIQEADHFLETVRKAGLKQGDLLVLDLEATDGRSASEVNAWAKRWLEHVTAETGVKPFFYSSWSFAQEHGSGLGDYPLWVAHYGKKAGTVTAPAPWKQWTVHQYSDTGWDHNVSRVTPESLRALGYQNPA